MSDLFPPELRNTGPYRTAGRTADRPARRVVETYDYLDEAGELLYQVCRTDPKGFFQRRPDGRGGWATGLGEVRRVLYRLPELLARPAWPVLLVEGERDVHALEAVGLLATTAAMGAGNWLDDYARSLRGRRVVILPDNDSPGRAHAERAAGSLLVARAESVRVVELPGLPDKGDVRDWLATHTREELIAAIRAVPEFRLLAAVTS
ncbi:MAG: toprim domain-containing protein [Acidimicrobiales bacterium]|nr:toprim domain-containing protein [Acidimicrobiales bacterium]